MKRSLVLAAATAAMLVATAAEAQVTVDPIGLPLRRVSVTLEHGKTYRLRTDFTLTAVGSAIPDTVLSLRDGAAATATTVAGADGCDTPDGFRWGPSCFTFTVPGAAGTGSRTYQLYLRAWRTSSPGQTALHVMDVATEIETPIIETITFGGGVITRSHGSARFVAHTTHLPGRADFHEIWNAAGAWQIGRSDRLNGRVASRTATADVANPDAVGLGGFREITFGQLLMPGGGGVRLIESDAHLAGRDVDADGLSLSVETALGSCDRATQVLASGTRCDSLPGCASPTSPRCLASLRDTDHDGLRDDLEVFGRAGAELPRYGASPGHMDVFVELDTNDQDGATAGCQGLTAANVQQLGGDGSATANFFSDVDAIYGQAPARVNPDGLPGVRVHWDVGVTNPDPLDTRWGAWGGGNTCLPAACSRDAAFANAAPCAANTFADARKWIFRYAIDGANGTGAGQADPGKQVYWAVDASHHVHELGHLLLLDHGGPPGAAGGNAHSGNFRFNYVSRMNYTYQDYGGTTGADDASWSKVAFSSGQFADRPMSAMFADETCPLPGLDPTLFPTGGTSFPATQLGAGGCVDVDWNQDTLFTDGWHHVESLIPKLRTVRWSRLRQHAIQRSAPAAAIVNGVLLHAYGVVDGNGVEQLPIRGESTLDCAIYPLPVDSPNGHPEFQTGGTYPGCYRPGTPVMLGAAAEGIAIAPVASGGGEDALIVWQVGGKLYHGVLAVGPSGNAQEMKTSWSDRGPVPGADLVNQTAGRREPALVRTATGRATLAYVGADNKLRTMVFDASTGTWSGSFVARDLAGADIYGWSAPTTTLHEGKVMLALVTPGLFDPRITVFTRVDPTVAEAERRWRPDAQPVDYAGPVPNTRPALVSAPSATTPGRQELWVFFESDFGKLEANLSFGSLGFWWNHTHAVQAMPTGIAVVYDDRPNAIPGLRVFRTQLATRDDCPGKPVDTQGFCVSEEPATYKQRLGFLMLDPFAQGIDPAFYTDYDDWTGLQYGACRKLQELAAVWAPASGDAYNPTPYRGTADCGDRPVYLEP